VWIFTLCGLLAARSSPQKIARDIGMAATKAAYALAK